MTYISGTHESLGPGWDVMHVIRKEHGISTDSVLLARDMNGSIIRLIGFFPYEWERITDEPTLRVAQQCFDNRDTSAAEESAAGLEAEYGKST